MLSFKIYGFNSKYNSAYLFNNSDLQLEDKLKEKIDPDLAEKIDLSTEQDLFHGYVSIILTPLSFSPLFSLLVNVKTPTAEVFSKFYRL